MKFIFGLSTVASVALMASAFPALAQVNLTLGHTLMPDSPYQAFAERFKEEVEERTNGEVTVTIFGQSQLGGEVRMLQSVRGGAQSIVITSSAPMENSVPEYALLGAPYLFENLEEANTLLQGEFGDKLLSYLPERGYHPLGFISAIERNVYTTNRAINSVEDFRNLKVRVIQSPAYVESYQALGAQPTPMNYSEVYIALQNGVVDGAENPPHDFISDRFYEVSKYYNLTKVHYMPALVVMSPAHYDRLTEEQQKAVDEAAAEARAYAIQFWVDGYEPNLQKARDANVEIVETDVTSLREATREVAERIIAATPRGEESMEALARARGQ